VLDANGQATDANGMLSGTGLVHSGVGTYTFAATAPATLTSELDSVVFTPTVNQGASGTTVTTKFSLATSDGIATTTNATTSVVTTETKIIGYSNTLVDISNPTNIFGSAALSINDSGEVVGVYSILTASNSVVETGFTDINGNTNAVTFPGALNTSVQSVNSAGDLAGFWSGTGGVSGEHAFVEHGGVFTNIPIADAIQSFALAINDKDVVLGGFTSNADISQSFAYDATTGNVTLLEDGNGGTFASDINDDGTIVGAFDVIDNLGHPATHGFIYSNGTFTTFDVAGATATEIAAINNNGDFAGNFVDSTGHQLGFLSHAGQVATFDMSIVRDLNNNDVVVGSSLGSGRALVYGGALTNNQVLDITPNTASGGTLFSINSNNVVAGGADIGSASAPQEQAFFATTITA
jgi:probable HAF family extracellular repeat protein